MYTHVVPREWQIWNFTGSLPVEGFPAGWDMAALLVPQGWLTIELGVPNPLISSETLDMTGRSCSPKPSCFSVCFYQFRPKNMGLF